MELSIIRKQTNNQIENKIKITESSIYQNNEDELGPYNSIRYEKQKFFCTQNYANSWICFEFKSHRIIPTHYTIRTCNNGWFAPVHYKIEVSNDNSTWFEIDKQNGGTFKDNKTGNSAIPY